jgi:hypothetical protein
LPDHHRRRRAQQQALAGVEDMVVEVAFAGDPDPATHHRQLAGPVIDAQRRTVVESNDPATICIELRFHHESPGSGTIEDGCNVTQ